jgi:hypothetical protein
MPTSILSLKNKKHANLEDKKWRERERVPKNLEPNIENDNG